MPRYWSHDVMEHSNALDLEGGIFAKDDPHEIALSLKRSAESSKRRKGTPFQSAMSMLNFFINRAGKNPASRRRVLESAKDELRKLYGRDPAGVSSSRKRSRRRTTSAKRRSR